VTAAMTALWESHCSLAATTDGPEYRLLSVKLLQYYCNALPISYFIDQRRLTFWYKIQNSNNIVLTTLSSLKHYSFVAIAAKYGINSHNVSFKNAVWQTFSSAVLAKC